MLIVLVREKVSFLYQSFYVEMYFFYSSSPFAYAVITLLLQHEPDKRPTALELSQSSLLPPRLEDEYFKGALRMMG